MTMKRLVVGLDALLRSRWCGVSARKAEAKLQSNSHSRAMVLEESPLNKQLKADNEGASRQHGLGLTDCLAEPDRPSEGLRWPPPSWVRLKHQWMCICLCVIPQSLTFSRIGAFWMSLGVINETFVGKNDLITLSVKLLFSERTILHFAATTTDLCSNCKIGFQNRIMTSF